MEHKDETTQQTTWETLRAEAVRAAQTAYAPYSGYRVGAAALLANGEIVTGANVENASYGLTLCAECSLVSIAATRGGGKIRRALCVNGAGDLIAPCGRCRQVLSEHAAEDFLLLTAAGERSLEEMLPFGFGAVDLERSPSEGRA